MAFKRGAKNTQNVVACFFPLADGVFLIHEIAISPLLHPFTKLSDLTSSPLLRIVLC